MKKPKTCEVCGKKSFSYKGKKLTIQNDFHFWKCNNCKLMFVHPLPTKKELDFFYTKIFNLPDHQGNSSLDKFNLLFASSKELKAKLKTKQTVLELGPGKGSVSKKLAKKHEVYAIDVTKEVHKLKKFGVKTITGDFMKTKFPKKFDVVIMMDVLEHMMQPKKVINKITANLNTNGLLILNVPNMKSIDYFLFRNSWGWITPPGHLFYFNERNLNKLLNNYKIVHEQTHFVDMEDGFVSKAVYATKDKVKHYAKLFLFRNGREKYLNNIKRGRGTKAEGFLKKNDFTNLIYPVLARKGKGSAIAVIARKK